MATILRTTLEEGQNIRDIDGGIITVVRPHHALSLIDGRFSDKWVVVQHGRVFGYMMTRYLEVVSQRSKLGFHVDVVWYEGAVRRIIEATA